MRVDKNYLFDVSLSLDCYPNKELTNAMIGEGRLPQNVKIKKSYGLRGNAGLKFRRTTVTSTSFLEFLTKGYLACNLFSPKSMYMNSDGSFGKVGKRDEYFSGSSVIYIDVDNTNYSNPEAYIDKIELKPTLYYSTYSNMKDGKAKFRLIYIFDGNIANNKFEYRYVSWMVNNYIENCVGEEVDRHNQSCSQYFNGACVDSIINPSYGISDIIYNISDFGIDYIGYTNFLQANCYYSQKNILTNAEIKHELERVVNELYATPLSDQEQSIVNDIKNNNLQQIDDCNILEVEQCSDGIISDMKKMDYSTFTHYNSMKYNFYYRKEPEQWDSGFFAIVDDDYFELPHTVNGYQIQDGHKRRIKLYLRMCLRRIINPNVDADTLLYNAYIDRQLYFDNSDGILSIDCLVYNVNRAMAATIDGLKNELCETINNLKQNRPKGGLIFKKGLDNYNHARGEAHRILIDRYYDQSKTVQENLQDLNNILPFSINKSTLYEFAKKLKKNDNDIYTLIDSTKSYRQNREILKDEGIKIDDKRLRKLLKEKKKKDPNNNNLDYQNPKVFVPPFKWEGI